MREPYKKIADDAAAHFTLKKACLACAAVASTEAAEMAALLYVVLEKKWAWREAVWETFLCLLQEFNGQDGVGALNDAEYLMALTEKIKRGVGDES